MYKLWDFDYPYSHYEKYDKNVKKSENIYFSKSFMYK